MGVAPYKRLMHEDWQGLERIINDLYRILNADTTLLDLATPPGSDSEIIYNNGGAYGADSTFTLNDSTKAVTCQVLNITTVAASVVDTDKFLVDDSNEVKFRTGAEVLSDIGGSASGHLHDGATLQHDAVNSDGGAFSFTTTGLVTFNQNLITPGLTVTNCAVLGSNSIVFQPDTDSATFIRVLDKNGSPVMTINSANEKVGFGTATPLFGKTEVYGNGVDTFLAVHEDAGTHQAGIWMRSGVNDFKIYCLSDGHLYFDWEGNTVFKFVPPARFLVDTLRNLSGGPMTFQDAAGDIVFGGTTARTLFTVYGTQPYMTLENTTNENGGRESRIDFRGNSAGAFNMTLARIEVSQDGSDNNQKGQITIYTNDGSDVHSPTLAVTIDSDQNVTFAGQILGLKTNITTQTNTDYTALSTDDVILVSTGATTRTISFAAASTLTGKIYHIKKIDAGAGLVTLDPDGAETIDGDITPDITAQYESFMIVSDGSNWHVI